MPDSELDLNIETLDAMSFLQTYSEMEEGQAGTANQWLSKRKATDPLAEEDEINVPSAYFDGLSMKRRKADGESASIYWGNDPKKKDHWIVITCTHDEPQSCFRLNMEVADAWISQVEDISVFRISNEIFEEDERLLFLFVDKTGHVIAHKQYPKSGFEFLGVAEMGSHYAWIYHDWLHLTEITTGEDFLNHQIPIDFTPNIADFDSHQSRIKLRAYGGPEAEISWENKPQGDIPIFTKNFETLSDSKGKTKSLINFWKSHPEPNAMLARVLAPMLETIEVTDLPEGSLWEKATKPDFFALGSQIYKAVGDQDETRIFLEKLTNYRNPFEVAEGAHAELASAKAAEDKKAMRELQAHLDEIILNESLNEYPNLVARCHRYSGEVSEILGDLKSAQKSYIKALDIDEAIGCDQRLELISKQLEAE